MTELAESTELHRSRNRWRAAAWFWFCAFVFSLVLHGLARPACASAQSPETWAAAKADQANFPKSDWGYFYYLSTDHLEAAKQITAGRTTAFTVSSFSREPVLERHVPVEVARGLYRIDLRGLQWAWRDWHAVLARYPYAPHKKPAPLVVRADWLVVELVDNFESQAGYQLLYGSKNIPKTRDEFLKFWDVTLNGSRDPLLLARVERDDDGDSPSLLDIRRIENRPTSNRGYAWGTEDNSKANFSTKTDPLEALLGNRKHDAEEWIVGFPKWSTTQGAGGMSQAYLLANREGKRQDRAPTEIVKDAHEMRGDPAIRNTIGCITCHPRGINALASNDLREIIASGVELYADKKSQELIEQQYLADLRLKVEIARNQEDYIAFVALVSGWGPEENVRAFKEFISDYDAPLTLEDVAREFHITPKDMELALGYASTRQIKLGARLASLPHGGKLERPYFESQYEVAFFAVELWRQATR